jgi:hypothetical protein
MAQNKIWQMALFQNLILFTNHYGNSQEMLEMASFLRYVDLYLTCQWGRFYVGHFVPLYFVDPPTDRRFVLHNLMRFNLLFGLEREV